MSVKAGSEADSPLEGAGFETSIPLTRYVGLFAERCGQKRPTEVASDRRTILAGPKVRIRLAPAASLRASPQSADGRSGSAYFGSSGSRADPSNPAASPSSLSRFTSAAVKANQAPQAPSATAWRHLRKDSLPTQQAPAIANRLVSHPRLLCCPRSAVRCVRVCFRVKPPQKRKR